MNLTTKTKVPHKIVTYPQSGPCADKLIDSWYSVWTSLIRYIRYIQQQPEETPPSPPPLNGCFSGKSGLLVPFSNFLPSPVSEENRWGKWYRFYGPHGLTVTRTLKASQRTDQSQGKSATGPNLSSSPTRLLRGGKKVLPFMPDHQ